MTTSAVLLLHGQPGSARDWAPVQERLNGTRTLAIDRPGWDGASRPADLSGNAAAACAALDDAGIERATVVGHSLGAAVAAWLAILHPERVASLVLVAPSVNRDSLYRIDYVLAEPVIGFVAGATTLAGVGLLLCGRPVRRRLADFLALEERYLRRHSRSLLTPGTWRAFASDQRALVAGLPDLEASLGAISAPTTVVAGREDRMVPIAALRRLVTQIAGAELVVVERAGHLLPQQQPERVAEVIAAAVADGPEG